MHFKRSFHNSQNLYSMSFYQLSDYPTFGSPMPTRQWNDPNSKYKYGFNGMENDDDINVDGGSYDFGGRIYDSRLGRWLSLDPLLKKFADVSPFNFAYNCPILFLDKDGEIIDLSALTADQLSLYEAKIKVLKESPMFKKMYERLEQSTTTYKIGNSGIRGGGSASTNNSSSFEIKIDLNQVETYVQELFHAYQFENRSNWAEGTTMTDLEAEGEVATFLIMNEVYMATCNVEYYYDPMGGKKIKSDLTNSDEGTGIFDEASILNFKANPNYNREITGSGDFDCSFQEYKQLFVEFSKDRVKSGEVKEEEIKSYLGETSTSTATNITSLCE